MLIQQQKCFFVHCHKCAGESVELALSGSADVGHGGDQFEGSPEKHFSAAQYRLKYGAVMWDEYYTFSFVRNPWARIISWVSYRNKRFGRGSDITPDLIKADLAFPYIRHNSYHQMLFDNVGNLLVDYVGKVENLQADYNTVCDKLKIDHVDIPHTNKSNHKNYWDYYDDETADLVSKIYQKDIEYFNYKFLE